MDDLCSEHISNKSSVHHVYSQHTGPRYPTASEEKANLTKAHMKVRTLNNNDNDLPPSYEEAARSHNIKTKPYPKVKTSSKTSDHPYNSSSKSRHRDLSTEKKTRTHSDERRNHYSSTSTRREKVTSSRNRDKQIPSHRRKTSKEKSSDKTSQKKNVPKNIDTIDKLDVTGLFGGAFHHDGPFDACTPHRNKNNKVAPVLAFPLDGPNSTISGTTKTKCAMNVVFGRDDIDDDDTYIYHPSKLMSDSNSSINTLDAIKPSNNITQFDAKTKTELVHGPITQGLGSTTFLDGAPAAPAAIRDNKLHKNQSGLQRKKSITQKLQKNNKTNANYQSSDLCAKQVDEKAYTSMLKLAKTHSGHLESNDEEYDDDNDSYLRVRFDEGIKKESTGNKLLRRVKSLKVNRKA